MPARSDTASKNHCSSARRGLAFYRIRASNWKILRGVESKPRLLQPRGCAHTLWLAKEWRSRAWRARQSYYRWLEDQYVLDDFVVRDGNHAWLKAVDEVQKVFPGTRNWLRSCSAPTSEGGWGRWVTYRDAYSAEYAAANYIVGGWLQFKLPTFKGFFRRGLEHARSLGYKIPQELRQASDVEAWQSPLAQALAGGWAASNGQQGHWVGSGC